MLGAKRQLHKLPPRIAHPPAQSTSPPEVPGAARDILKNFPRASPCSAPFWLPALLSLDPHYCMAAVGESSVSRWAPRSKSDLTQAIAVAWDVAVACEPDATRLDRASKIPLD